MSLSESKVTGVLPVESSTSALAWGPIIGGAVAATGITLILLLVGSGMGLTMVSPWSSESSSAATVGVSAAIWLVVVQWLSSALGGYLTGRLRTKWAAAHTDEVFFAIPPTAFSAGLWQRCLWQGFWRRPCRPLPEQGRALSALLPILRASRRGPRRVTAPTFQRPTSLTRCFALNRSPSGRVKMMERQARKSAESCCKERHGARCRITTKPISPASSQHAPISLKRMPVPGSTQF